MTDLQKTSIDKDLMILDIISDDCSIIERDWQSIINLYNQQNTYPYSISPIICAKIIQKIKDGGISKYVFKEYGISFINFKNKYDKVCSEIEQLVLKSDMTNEDFSKINMLRSNPTFILGQDIDKASAFHFNQGMQTLQEGSEANSSLWIAYMKEAHKEEFTEKQDKKTAEIVIHLQAGLLESI